MVISIIISIGDRNEEKNLIFGQNFVWRCPDRHCNGHDRFAAKFCRWRRDGLERPFEQIDSFISVDDCSFLQCHFVYPGIYIHWSKIHPENIAGQHCFPGLDICQRINFLLPLKSDPLVSAIIAGLLVGIGSGLVLKGDGSNGGFDILGVIFNKYFKISVAVVMNICDCLVLLAQALQKDFMQNLYGLIVIFICAFAVNRVLSYGQSQCEIMIMSKEHIKIKQRIYEEVDAGLTLLHAESGYLSEKMKVIMVVTQYKKIAEVKQIAVSEDPTAFVFVSDVHSVSGKGYTISR